MGDETMNSTRLAPEGAIPSRFLWLVPVIGLVGVFGSSCTQNPASSAVLPEDGWQVASPGNLGMSEEGLSELTASIREGNWGNVHAVLIEREGKLVYEEYFSGEDQRWGQGFIGVVDFDRDTMHDIRSVSKTVVSTLIGIALHQGVIGSLDATVGALLPAHAAQLSEETRGITLANLLTMSAGLEWDEMSVPYSDLSNDERRMTASPDPVAFVLGRDLVATPGTVWNYSGGLTHILGVILQEVTGQPLAEYAGGALFEPLGIKDTEWLGDLNGTPAAASGLRMRARDLAKIGSVFLHGGKWGDVRVFPEEWAKAATGRQISYTDPDAPDFVVSSGYGYQWWHNEYETRIGVLEVWTAVGNGGQRIIIVPEIRMVITMLAGEYNNPDTNWNPEYMLIDRIIPSIDEYRSNDSQGSE
jgi:CubicO group peptidase (beta-lactamase class C family)